MKRQQRTQTWREKATLATLATLVGFVSGATRAVITWALHHYL